MDVLLLRPLDEDGDELVHHIRINIRLDVIDGDHAALGAGGHRRQVGQGVEDARALELGDDAGVGVLAAGVVELGEHILAADGQVDLLDLGEQGREVAQDPFGALLHAALRLPLRQHREHVDAVLIEMEILLGGAAAGPELLHVDAGHHANPAEEIGEANHAILAVAVARILVPLLVVPDRRLAALVAELDDVVERRVVGHVTLAVEVLLLAVVGLADILLDKEILLVGVVDDAGLDLEVAEAEGHPRLRAAVADHLAPVGGIAERVTRLVIVFQEAGVVGPLTRVEVGPGQLERGEEVGLASTRRPEDAHHVALAERELEAAEVGEVGDVELELGGLGSHLRYLLFFCVASMFLTALLILSQPNGGEIRV